MPVIQIDRSLCSGFGSCADLAPSLFQVGDDGIAVVLREVDDLAAAMDAADSCPMGAITVIDDEGRVAA